MDINLTITKNVFKMFIMETDMFFHMNILFVIMIDYECVYKQLFFGS